MDADAPLPPQIWAWSDKARLVLDEAYPHMLLDDETAEALGKKTEQERARATFRRDIVTSRCLTRRSDRLEKIAKAAADYKPLSIDDSLLDLSKSKRPPRLTPPLLYAKCAARRALEIGYYEVLRVRRAMNDLKASGFDVIERTAEDAAAERIVLSSSWPGVRSREGQESWKYRSLSCRRAFRRVRHKNFTLRPRETRRLFYVHEKSRSACQGCQAEAHCHQPRQG